MKQISLARFLLGSAAILVTHAARADGIGWAWYNGSGSLNPAYSYNSSGGAVSVAQLETGLYNVTFSGLGGTPSNNGVGVASAYGSNVTCQVGNIVPVGADMNVEVDCWNPTGGQANTDFSLLYEQHSSWSGGGGNAYVYNSSPGTAINMPYVPASTGTFNSAGGTNTITRTGPGLYTVSMPGLSHLGGTVQATAGGYFDTSNGGFSARCQPTSWGVQSGTEVAFVACVDGNNQPVNTYFQLSFVIAATPGNGFSGLGGAYAWANKARPTKPYTPNLGYQFNNYGSGALTAYRTSRTGEYVVAIPAGATPTSTIAIASAHNLPGGYCNIAGWTNSSVNVDCFNAKGQATNGQFQVLFEAAF